MGQKACPLITTYATAVYKYSIIFYTSFKRNKYVNVNDYINQSSSII